MNWLQLVPEFLDYFVTNENVKKNHEGREQNLTYSIFFLRYFAFHGFGWIDTCHCCFLNTIRVREQRCMETVQEMNWSRQFAFATCGGVRKSSWILLIQTFDLISLSFNFEYVPGWMPLY